MFDFILALIARVELIAYKYSRRNGNAVGASMIRPDLPEELRVTEAECLEAFGVPSKKKLSKTARKAVEIIARIHRGCDNNAVVEAKAEKLAKLLRQRHTDLVEQHAREIAIADLRALDSEREVTSLSTQEIVRATEIRRMELRATCAHFISEVNSLARKLGRTSIVCDDPQSLDGDELVAVHERLASHHEEADKAFAAKEAVCKPLRDECEALCNSIRRMETELGVKLRRRTGLPKGFTVMDADKLEELRNELKSLERKTRGKRDLKLHQERIKRGRRYGHMPPAKRPYAVG